MATPPFKWVGGKRQLLPELLVRIPNDFGLYLEPFCGGAALFFGLQAENKIKAARLSDTNAELIGALKDIRADVDSLITTLGTAPFTNTSRTAYELIRGIDNLVGVNSTARFIYLNRLGYNGLYRVNKKGKFNVPYGRHTNPKICQELVLRAASLALRMPHTALHTESFESVVNHTGKNDFVYFDPPYWPVSKTSSFTSFTAGGFDEAAQHKLAEVTRQLHAMGVFVMLSNSDVPAVRELYKDFRIDSVFARRSVNSDGAKRGGVAELIIRTY